MSGARWPSVARPAVAPYSCASMRLALMRRFKTGLRRVRGAAAGFRRPPRLPREDLLLSAFNEQPPAYPGGIWVLREARVRPLYEGYGVFGLAWCERYGLVLGVTRVESEPLLAFRPLRCGRYEAVPVEYHRWIQPLRAHGIAVRGDDLYVVATQGDADAPMCSNDDFRDHRVGKVIISKLAFDGARLRVRESRVWNPYACDHHHHYNDIVLREDGIYVASFSVCQPDGQYVPRGSVSRFGYDLSGPTVVVDGLEAPHSLQVVDGVLYVCSSGASSIVSADLAGAPPLRTTLRWKSLDNFIRGLHVTSDVYVVGLNRSAGRSHAAHLTDSMNGVLVVDRHDGLVARIEMPSQIHNLYSILPVPMRAAGTGAS